LGFLNKIVSSTKERFRGDTLEQRCARSGFFLVIGAVLARGLSFASKIILVRLLMPADMGLMVMILTLTAFFETMTELGIKYSVIQYKNGAEWDYMNVAWWFQGLRGVVLYAVAFFVSPWICQFYFAGKDEMLTLHRMPELVMLARVAFLTIPLNGFVSPEIYVLMKEFKFGKSVFLNQGSVVIGTIITIILAFLMRNIWAIVIGSVGTVLVLCVVSFVFCPFRPGWSFHRDSFRHVSKFAQGVIGLPILTYAAFNGDVLVAGKLLSASLVGMYGMASVLAQMPKELLLRVIGPLLMPAFAEKQEEKKALCRGLLKVTRITALVGIPLMALAIICGKTLLMWIYTPEYAKVVVPFGLLTIYAMLHLQAILMGKLLFGIGQPDKHRFFVGLRAIFLLLLIYPAIRFLGLAGAAGVLVLANFAALCLQVVVLHKIIGLGIADYAVSWMPGILMAVPVVVIVWLVQSFKPELPFLSLLGGILMCLAVYMIWVFRSSLVKYISLRQPERIGN
jgi:O-antigen/teichoic acid export membrane protein